MAGVDSVLLFEFAVLLVVAGAVAGFLAGLFGIGGGTVLVPAFFQVFGAIGVPDEVKMHLSVGSSLAIVVVTSLRSFMAHRSHKVVDESLLRGWLVAVPAGALLATAAAAYMSSGTLRAVFSVICVLIAFKLLSGRDDWRLGADLPRNPVKAGVGVGIGFLSTLMGIGGGVLNNTFMTSYSRPIHQAVATSAGVGVLIAIPGFIGYVIAGWGRAGLPPFSTGFVNWMTVALIIPLSIFVTPYGVKAAHAMPKRRLEMLLGCYLLVVAARFVWTLI
ncbi:MAG: sulfite exporter TauE/SafE family protein [Rhizobiaceae bacterium]